MWDQMSHIKTINNNKKNLSRLARQSIELWAVLTPTDVTMLPSNSRTTENSSSLSSTSTVTGTSAIKKGLTQIVDPSKLPAEEYLEQSKVTPYLKDAITLLLENRPPNPIAFLSDYFQNVTQGSSRIVRSYRYIRLTKRSRQAFLDNLVSAYNSIESVPSLGVTTLATTSKNNNTNGSSTAPKISAPASSSFSNNAPSPRPASRPTRPVSSHNIGLTGAEFAKLLTMICSDFPQHLTANILRYLSKGDSDLVSFEEFAAGVNACLIYEEFISHAERLFHEIDKKGKGKIERKSFVTSLKQYCKDLREKNSPIDLPSVPSDADIEVLIPASGSPDIAFHDFALNLFRLTTPTWRHNDQTQHVVMDGQFRRK